MPYARTWTKSNPPGTQAANTADDEIRNLREDIEERIAELVTGWSTASPTDPVVPVAVIKGNVTGKKEFLHHPAFSFLGEDTGSISRTTDYAETLVAGIIAMCVLPIPNGVTLTEFSVFVSRSPAASPITLSLRRRGYSSITAATVVDSVTGVPGAAGTTLTKVISHAVVADNVYYLDLSAMDAFTRLYGARITYNTPDCRNTL